MRNKIKKISVITLNFNSVESDLHNAITSLINQKFDHEYEVEYILIDDGSKNLNENLVTELLQRVTKAGIQCKFLKNSSNLGTVATFNKAILKSTGELIIPLSTDDRFYDEFVLRDIINEFNKRKSLILTALRAPTRNGIEQSTLPKKKIRKLFADQKKLYEYISYRGNIISGACTYYHKEIFNRVGLFDESYRLLEDYPFYIQVLENNIKIELFERKTINYGLNGVSYSKNEYLDNDYKLLNNKILLNAKLPTFKRRYFYYHRLLPVRERLRLANIFKYPEQVLIFIVKIILKRAVY